MSLLIPIANVVVVVRGQTKTFLNDDNLIKWIPAFRVHNWFLSYIILAGFHNGMYTCMILID